MWLKIIYLEVWSKVKRLFGKRKMAIEETINAWFDGTDVQIRDKINSSSPVDGLCDAVLHSARDYCFAVLLLLQKGHSMPAMALLRCLYELSMKLFWCLRVPDKTDNKEADKIIEHKSRRWEKDTLCRIVRYLKELKKTADAPNGDYIEQEISRLESETLFSDSTVECLPQFANLVGELPDLIRNELHPMLYLQFNNAVHLDVKSLVSNYKSKHGGKSVPDSNVLIKYCLTLALYVNWAVRKHYDVDISVIMKEYHTVMETLQ
jgi:hypothetical protein